MRRELNSEPVGETSGWTGQRRGQGRISVGRVVLSVVLGVAMIGGPQARAAHAREVPVRGVQGCAAGRAVLGRGGSDTVIVGDSLTVGEWCYGQAGAKWRGPVSVDARVGRATREGLQIAGRLGKGASRIVLALGTNDAAGASREQAAAWERDVRRFVRARLGVEVWLVRIVVPQTRSARAFNDAIARLDAEPNVSVVEWVPRAGVLSRDGVHLWGDGANGYRERAAVIQAAVQG